MASIRCVHLASVLALATSAWSIPGFAQDADADGVPNSIDAFPCDPSTSAELFVPSRGTFGTLAFEDHWPAALDSDYNDVVLAYSYALAVDASGRAGKIRVVLQPLATGGRFEHGLGLTLPVPVAQVARAFRTIEGQPAVPLVPSPSDANLTVVVSANIGPELFAAAPNTILNATPGAPTPSRSVEILVELATPVALDATLAPFDVFIFRAPSPAYPNHVATHEIHRLPYCGTSNMDGALFGTGNDGSNIAARRCFVDGRGLPSALDMPSSTLYPREGIDISLVFPQILSWAASGGTVNPGWYGAPVTTQAYSTPLQPAFPGGIDSIRPDSSCLPRAQRAANFAAGQRSLSPSFRLTGSEIQPTATNKLSSSPTYRMRAGIVSGGNL